MCIGITSFFPMPDNAKDIANRKETTIFMESLNTKVNKKRDDEIVGKFELGNYNVQGEKLV